MKYQKKNSRLAFAVLCAICLLWLLPILVMFSSSVSSNDDILKNGYCIIPRVLDLEAYRYLLSRSGALLHAFAVSAGVMLVGTVTGVLFTAMLAYAVSQRKLKGKKLVVGIVLFTMLFNGGLAPTYMIYTQVFNVRDTVFALLLPNLFISGYNILLMRAFFMHNISVNILEAAEIDGVSPTGAFFRIVLPLSLPVIATVSFLQATMYWNDWFNALLYIDDTALMGLQPVMNKMLNNANFFTSLSQGSMNAALGGVQPKVPVATLRMAMAFMGILPSMIIFPFVRQYMVSGLTLGGVKE